MYSVLGRSLCASVHIFKGKLHIGLAWNATASTCFVSVRLRVCHARTIPSHEPTGSIPAQLLRQASSQATKEDFTVRVSFCHHTVRLTSNRHSCRACTQRSIGSVVLEGPELKPFFLCGFFQVKPETWLFPDEMTVPGLPSMYQEVWSATFCQLPSHQKRQRRRVSSFCIGFKGMRINLRMMFTLTKYLEQTAKHPDNSSKKVHILTGFCTMTVPSIQLLVRFNGPFSLQQTIIIMILFL